MKILKAFLSAVAEMSEMKLVALVALSTIGLAFYVITIIAAH